MVMQRAHSFPSDAGDYRDGLMTRQSLTRGLARLTTTFGLAIALAPALPAQNWTYGPFRITAGRWHSIGLHLRKGEYFYVQATGTMRRYNVTFGPDGYQLQNGNIAGRIFSLSGTTLVTGGTNTGGYAQFDGSLDFGVMFAENINESDAGVTNGSFSVWVTAPANRCQQLTCGFTNNTGTDITGGNPGPGNVATWSPYMEGILASGYQLAIAEVRAAYGANNDADVQYVSERLGLAQQHAVTGNMDGRGIGSLITMLAQTRNARSISSQIAAVGDSYQQAISRSCTCGGVPVNPAWVFNAGRNLAYAEAATYQNWDATTMYNSLSNLRAACINSAILPISAIDGVMQLLRTYQPAQLPAANAAAPKNELFAASRQRCVCY
jgi:hypothetical protein